MEPLYRTLELALLPLIVALSFRSLSGLGPVRRWLAIGMRCVVITAIVLALTRVGDAHPDENLGDFGCLRGGGTSQVERFVEQLEALCDSSGRDVHRSDLVVGTRNLQVTGGESRLRRGQHT